MKFGTSTTPVTNFDLIVGTDSLGNYIWRTSFGNHAFATYNGAVYDACGGPILEIDLLIYFNIVIDFDANKQANTLSGATVFAETSTDVTVDYYSIISLS